MPLRILPCGDRAVLAEYGTTVDPAVSERVRSFAVALAAGGHSGILQVTPGYRSALVEYDPLILDWDTLGEVLHQADARALHLPPPPAAEVRVPVCYGGEFGPDLPDVAAHTGLSPAEVVARHTAPAYRVYCIGFAAGFPYLGGLDPALHTPRLPSPRTLVPAGSVGIGGEQTGVYPLALPGGWRIIGRTPVSFFDPRRQPPGLVGPGDYVRFFAISPEEFARSAADGGYRVERTQRL